MYTETILAFEHDTTGCLFQTQKHKTKHGAPQWKPINLNALSHDILGERWILDQSNLMLRKGTINVTMVYACRHIYSHVSVLVAGRGGIGGLVGMM